LSTDERISSLEKGHELEIKIEKFFQLNGYSTQRNIVLEGKSGGKHEIDILAEKSDGITSFRVLVECKAWDKPIEKDVVSKISYVMRDLGLNKAIIVSLKGWTIGAEKSASELGVELWGPDAIEQKLGRVSLAELETIEFKRVVKGFPLVIMGKQIRPLVEKESKGILGFGKEEIAWIKAVWLPCYLFQISCSRVEGLIKANVKTVHIWNLYDALMGHWFASFEKEPYLEEVEARYIVQPKIKDVKIKNKIIRAFEKASEVVTRSAIERYNRELTALGIPLGLSSISIDSITGVFYPFYISLLKSNEKERIIAIDGTNGVLSKTIGYVLTANLSYLKLSIKSGDG